MTGYQVVSQSASIPANSGGEWIEVSAPSGKVILGAGFDAPEPDHHVAIFRPKANTSGTVWQMVVQSTSSSATSATLYAVCVDA